MKPQEKKRKKISTHLVPHVEMDSDVDSTPVAQCMRNSVVLRTILSELSTSDLINCRLVNKLWYSEVNSTMHLSNIALKISSEFLVDQVKQLTDLIPNMSLPFNGLSFRKFPCPQNNEDSGYANLQEFLQVLPPIKHLRFDDSSASEELILRILESNANHLEILSFENAGENLPPEIVRAIVQLNKLRKIKGTTGPEAMEDKENLRAIIERCESLESIESIVFYYGIDDYDLDDIPDSRLHVIKNFDLVFNDTSLDWSPIEKYLQIVPASRRFTSLRINSVNCSRKSKRSILNLVNSCKETLTSLKVDLESLQFRSVLDICGEPSRFRRLRIEGSAESVVDIESELLGIFPEEYLLLEQMNLTVAQLRKLQLVPLRPALHHLTGLVYLKLSFSPEDPFSEYLLYWRNKRNRIDYRQRHDYDASKILKALSLEKMKSLWNQH